MTFPAGNCSGANSAPTARTNTYVLEMSCPTAAGPVGETIVAVSQPQVIRNTNPVLVSADAPAVPKRSAAVTAANATAIARLSVLDDRASNAVRFPDSVMVAPFSAGSFGG